MMMNLNGEPDIYLPETSMRAAAKRTRRPRMQQEAFSTEENVENTMKLPLRERPLEFIKSEKLGDTMNVINLRNNEQERVNGESAETKEVIEEEITIIKAENDKAEVRDKKLVKSQQGPEQEIELEIKFEQEEPISDPISTIPNDQLFFIDDSGSVPKNIKTVQVECEPAKPKHSSPSTAFIPTLSIGHVHLSTTQNDKGEILTKLPKLTKKLKNINSFNPDQSIYELDELNELEDELLDEKNIGNRDLYKSYQEYISNVMGNLFDNDEEDDENDDEVFAELDDDFEEEANFIAEGISKDDSNATIEQSTSTSVQDLKLDDSEEEGKEPEYGFLPEDYESFDHSLVEVFNIREGFASCQFHIKSFRLTGTYDTQWVDQELFEDFLAENGMPEYRLNAYFRYIKAQLEPKDEPPSDYEIPFDDSESEDEEEEEVMQMSSSDEEGLDELVNFTKKYDGVRDLEFETRTIKTKGKGRKKQLDLDSIAGEFGEALQDQWARDRERKREKRQNRESNIAAEHSSSSDLCLKYPYTIYIKDIRLELDEFLGDSGRRSLTFPPLDPHGNRTVQNMAHAFNMKSRKFGAGTRQHVVVIKNKRTYRSLPEYDSIQRYLRQRPVFNRIDQKRPRAEIDNEKSSRRGNPSKAHVKEGDIVGANAPEISGDNFGRRLLIKMGWRTGQGLGLDNNGIAEPVMAKVKKTKLGIR
jgi:hypothetical protein